LAKFIEKFLELNNFVIELSQQGLCTSEDLSYAGGFDCIRGLECAMQMRCGRGWESGLVC
jgi:hypothetical protein